MLKRPIKEHRLDPHYTPAELANLVIATTPQCPTPARILDLTAGYGSLLLAARNRWPSSKLYGADIDPRAVTRLKRLFGYDRAAKCDILNSHQRSSNEILAHLKKKVTLLVLNPPFSARGSTRFEINTRVGPIHCSRAMAFVLEGLQFLRDGGSISALLPASCFHSVKDKEAMCYLESVFNEIRSQRISGADFQGCSVNVVIAHFGRYECKRASPAVSTPSIHSIQLSANSVEVMRGSTFFSKSMMFPASARDKPFVHSTNLQDHSLTNVCRWARGRSVCSSVVLVPRVGSHTVHKVVYVDDCEAFVLSDCVIALRASSRSATLELHRHLVINWQHIETYYGGTCAQYITVDGLIRALAVIGVGATARNFGEMALPASQPPGVKRYQRKAVVFTVV